jgi:methionyl-tRNA formyltransferase
MAKTRDRLGIGRRRGRFSSIRSAARHYRIPCEVVDDVNAEAFRERLRALEIDLVVSVSCPQLFRRKLIELPAKGCLNIHGARLPQYRGIAPSFWMMANGESVAGVTVFLVNEDIDAGDVVEFVEFPIEPDESLHEFIQRSKQIACDALLRAVDQVQAGDLRPRPLNKDGGSYYSFPTREAYRVFRARGRRLW